MQFMPISLTGNGQVFQIHASESITKAEVLNLWDDIERHPIYPQATAALTYIPSQIQWKISGDEISDLARKIPRLKPMRWALVTGDALSFGMVRMFALQAQGDGIYEPFKDEASARDWLEKI
jgi:hypothetical protein